DQTAVIKRAMQDAHIDSKQFSPGVLKHAISAAKSKLLTPAEFSQTRASYFDEVILRVYERYEDILRRANAVDFDDLIMRLVRMLEHNAEVRDKYQNRFVHVLIDEFQDTNLAQYRMAKLLAGKYRNLAVVGDPDQSIYSWRQADITNILNFERDFPDAKVVKLEQNYRSTKTILSAAGKVIELNQARKAKELWTDNQQGLPITVHDATNEQDEALFVVNEIDKLVKEGHKPGDCAVLFRTNAQSRPLEEAFVRYGLPYRLIGAMRFYERREVKDVLAYLRLVHNPFDDISLLRIVNVPSRGIGERTLDELQAWAGANGVPVYTAIQMLERETASSEPTSAVRGLTGSPRTGAELPPELNPRATRSLIAFLQLIDALREESNKMPIADFVDALLAKTGYRDALLASDDDGEERLENVMELRTAAEEMWHLDPGEALPTFLEQVALVADTDNLDQRANATNLITLHQAKGLEFPVVFIVGMEEGILPHQRSYDDPAQMEEERRLCYVGMTRARERLYLLRAYRRSAMGRSGSNPPSRFLKDLPSELTTSPRRAARQSSFLPSTNRASPANPGGLSAKSWMPAHFRKDAASPNGGPHRESGDAAPVAPAFKSGERVKHPTFGDGIVVACKPSGGDQEITVAFQGVTGVKKLLMQYAKLERV
ncbi:MAG: UvrD-helicase domain-containing protein, partial [Chloroflexi bacterium]|nr:UvrD-helicase domain-containing protein [Chloroflexota bacterium]